MNVVLIAQLPEGFLQTEGNSAVRNQNRFRDKLGRNIEFCAQRANAITISKQTLNMKLLNLCIQSQIYDCCNVFVSQGNIRGITPTASAAL